MTPDQIKAKAKVLACHSCPLHTQPHVPMSVPASPHTPTIAVQGEAPGADEAKAGPTVRGVLGKEITNQYPAVYRPGFRVLFKYRILLPGQNAAPVGGICLSQELRPTTSQYLAGLPTSSRGYSSIFLVEESIYY